MPQNNLLTRASTAIILLFTLAAALTLISCGPSTPSPATVTPAQITAAPTLTQAAPSPTRTQLPPTATQTHTPTSTSIANTPTAAPSSTPSATASPTFIAETPLNDPGKYKLAAWDQQAALDAISILDQQWNKTKQEMNWIYAQAVLDEEKKVVALAEQEALTRYPQLPLRKKLEWKTALDLAIAGKQNATQYLVALLQSELDQQPSLITSSFSALTDYGFTFEVTKTDHLFDEKTNVWLVKVGTAKTNDGYLMDGSGTVFSIYENPEGHFLVYTVGGYWLPYWGDIFEVYFNPTMPGTKPEVSIVQTTSQGGGVYFMESWLCNYQWNGNQWVPVLTNTKGEAVSTAGLDFPINQSCFIDMGGIGEPVFLSQDNGKYVDTINVWRGLDPFSCNWDISYSFHKENGAYQQEAIINNISSKLSDPRELYCLETTWDLADIIKNKNDIILYMENLIADWPDLINQTWNGDWTIAHATDPDFYNQLQFELGRFYTLSNEFEKAKTTLAKIANKSPENSDRWTYIAHHYLANLDHIDQAEEGLARDLSSLCWHCQSTSYIKPIYEKAFAALYTEGSLDSVKEDVQTLLKNADPSSCHVGNYYVCAELLYLHGLANELDGNTSEAVTAYWLVWHNYPRSLYAVAAQQKLELVKKP